MKKRKNGRDFARRLICAEKLQGAKNGCNLLTGQKAAKADWIVFDSGRSGGGPIRAIGRKKQRALAAGRLIGAIRAIGKKITGRWWRVNLGHW